VADELRFSQACCHESSSFEVEFYAGMRSYINTRACGKTAKSPHFTRVSARRYQKQPHN
jgi:hypothetical protein